MQRKTPTSPDDDVLIRTNPTHLDRVPGWIVLGVWAWCVLMAGFVNLWFYIPLWLLLPPVVLVVIATATAEAATDVEVLGVFSMFLRSRMGQRSAFEWADARAHYFRLVELPAGRATCERYSRSLRQRTQSWRTTSRKLIRR